LDRQRVDKWLWHARVVRTRTAAAALADTGKVRLNGARIDASSKLVRPGDVLTLALDRVRVLKVLDFSERRGSAALAGTLYEDLTPSEPSSVPESVRDAGSGRPTKRERRALDRLKWPDFD
jgi:ribosome-associated heat shock protein Hsp15